MRIVFSCTNATTLMSARRMIELGYEVIIIEPDKAKIDQLSGEIDCSFLHGDASRPAILGQADPKKSDFLICLSENDQMNIITSLLGRSMGFTRVVTSINDADLEKLCRELGLDDTVIPARTISQHLENLVRGIGDVELSTVLKGDARFFTLVAGKDEAVTADALDLPNGARVIFYYRDGEFRHADADTGFRKGDEIVILTHANNLAELKKRWSPLKMGNETGDERAEE